MKPDEKVSPVFKIVLNQFEKTVRGRSIANKKRIERGSDQSAHLPHAVGEEESYIVAHLPEQRQGLLMVILCLTTEPCYEVTAKAHSWEPDTNKDKYIEKQ